MTANPRRRRLASPCPRNAPGREQAITAALFLSLLAAFLPAGCGILQRSELMRVQKQRDAAIRYPSANWIERCNIVSKVAGYYGKDKNDLVIGILTYAARDPQPAVRIEAVRSLARIKSEHSLPLLKEIALEDRNENVRWYAIQALRLFKDPSTADIFIHGFEGSDWLVREESVKGMCSLDDATITARLIPYIIKAINDPSSSVMLTALRRIKTRDDRLYKVISEKLRNATAYNYSLLEACLIAIRGYKLDPKTNEKVISLLVHENPRIRVLALRVLKKESALKKPE